MSSIGGLAQPGSPRRGRAGLFASHPATTAPSEEDAGGLTRDRALILLAHLTLSVGHIFAVHQSSSGDADAKGGASGARGYKYSPATVVFLVRGPRPSPDPPASRADPSLATNESAAHPAPRDSPRPLRRRLSSSSSSSPSRRSRASSSVATRATPRGPPTSSPRFARRSRTNATSDSPSPRSSTSWRITSVSSS